jgi:hypothetical protein
VRASGVSGGGSKARGKGGDGKDEWIRRHAGVAK